MNFVKIRSNFRGYNTSLHRQPRFASTEPSQTIDNKHPLTDITASRSPSMESASSATIGSAESIPPQPENSASPQAIQSLLIRRVASPKELMQPVHRGDLSDTVATLQPIMQLSPARTIKGIKWHYTRRSFGANAMQIHGCTPVQSPATECINSLSSGARAYIGAGYTCLAGGVQCSYGIGFDFVSGAADALVIARRGMEC